MLIQNARTHTHTNENNLIPLAVVDMFVMQDVVIKELGDILDLQQKWHRVIGVV